VGSDIEKVFLHEDKEHGQIHVPGKAREKQLPVRKKLQLKNN
jgi:hypothetical protein